MYKILIFASLFLFSIAQTTAQSIGSVSLTYKGLFDTDTDQINDQDVKFSQNYLGVVAAATVTKKISAGYIFGLDKSVSESEVDGTKIINKSISHGAVARHYFPIANKIVAFSDIIYLWQLYDPTKTKFADGTEAVSDLERRGHKLKLVYGFAFYVKRNWSFDLKMNLASYGIVNTYQEEFDSGEMTKIESNKDFRWDLNGFPVANATIGIRYIIR
jgi:hypothetical protein